jgi:hypothetical protein
VKSKRARLSQLLFVICVAICLPTSVAGSGNNFPDCLHSDTPAGTLSGDPGCHKDILDLSGDATVQRALDFLKLHTEKIVFTECSNFPFTTKMPKTSVPYQFEIDYPTIPQSELQTRVPPMLHELGHIYQLRLAGSPAGVFEAHDNSSEKIELGADFLAGLTAQKLGIDPGPFERSLFLAGNYRENDHGRAEDRSAAFRNGYYYPLNKTTLDKAYQDFLDNRYSQITNL